MLGLVNSLIAVVLFALVLPVLVLPWIHRQYQRYGRRRGLAVAADLLIGYHHPDPQRRTTLTRNGAPAATATATAG